jgi:hypothetical protein
MDLVLSREVIRLGGAVQVAAAEAGQPNGGEHRRSGEQPPEGRRGEVGGWQPR